MRILLLSYCFPPIPLIEAQVTAKVMAALDAEIDVIAAGPGPWRLAPDPSLDGFVREHFGAVTRVRRPAAPWLVAAQGRLPGVGRRPDALRHLNRKVLRELSRRSLDRYDLLVTRSQFHSIHLVPLALGRHPPWVAHFSDPWVGNPSRDDGPVLRRLNAGLERRVLHAADRLVFTSERAAEFTLCRHDRALWDRARWAPHCFVPELFDDDAAPPAAKATVPAAGSPLLARHVGHLRWNRDPEPLLRALLVLRELEPGALDGLRIELIGLIAPGMLETPAARALPDGLVRSLPPVGYRDSLRAMRTAELLLVTEVATSHGVDLHAKVVDYAGAGVPIVGIVAEGPTADLIRSLGGWHGRPDDPQAGARALRAGLAAARTRRACGARAGGWGTPEVRDRHRDATIAGQLAEIYAECVASPIAGHQ